MGFPVSPPSRHVVRDPFFTAMGITARGASAGRGRGVDAALAPRTGFDDQQAGHPVGPRSTQPASLGSAPKPWRMSGWGRGLRLNRESSFST